MEACIQKQRCMKKKTKALKGIAITRDVEDLFLPDLNFLITSNQTDTAVTK